MDAVIQSFGTVLQIILQMIQLVVIASVIISWVGGNPNNQIVRAISGITEPLYAPFRRLTKNIPGPFDWAPLIVLLLVVFFSQLVTKLMIRPGGF